jgi:tetratricopeptide (TPR) repeat protein
VYKDNENHPGAAHFIIHSFDDPDHAILALPAAKVYADIAPASAHALHMPSHIFVQLGMWDRVINSNIEAYAAAIENIEKLGLPAGREDFHTLSWLAYANLMLGEYEKASENLSTALATVEKNNGNKRIYNGYLNMKARHMIEAGEWEDHNLMGLDTIEGTNVNWITAVGMSAAYRDDSEIVDAVVERLSGIEKNALDSGKAYEAKRVSIMQKQVSAIAKLVVNDIEAAVALAKEAAKIEIHEMQTPSGPPIPMKPSLELYAEILMAANRPSEAILAYEESLAWIPERTPSLFGFAKAASLSGEASRAEEMLVKIKGMPGMNLEEPLFKMTETMD